MRAARSPTRTRSPDAARPEDHAARRDEAAVRPWDARQLRGEHGRQLHPATLAAGRIDAVAGARTA